MWAGTNAKASSLEPASILPEAPMQAAKVAKHSKVSLSYDASEPHGPAGQDP